MKIAIIRKKYIFHGGAESFSRRLVSRLADAGHEVHIYAIGWEGNPQPGNIYSHRVPAVTFNSTLRDLSFALSVCRLLRKEKFDIVQSHDKTLCQDIYRAGDGCHIEWLRQRWKRTGLLGKLSIALNPYHRVILLIERMIFNGHRFMKVIAISGLVKKNILEHYHVDQGDIKVVYNGVDLDRFSPLNRDLYRKEIRNKYSISDDGFLALFVGSGFERKGLRFLLEAAELVPSPLTVLIAGKGPEKKYRRLVKRQNVIFCGPQREIHKYYAASDIFVFPTIYEPFGNVHLEALASGLPVITTSLSGAAEIIRDGVHGFVVTLPEDRAAIAEKITFLMDNPKIRETMCTNARKLAEEFSFERHTEKVLDLYKTIVDQKSPG
jgi:UDP-glucose:(heptosyl)LPS alpha-1,3-glucosyltransferase